jgi:parallel beta-helix repeat protein
MKKSIFFLFLATCCSFSAAYAQSLIALEHNGASTFFTDIPAAVTAAVSGDTIYLPGGSFPGFDIDKTLTIIGVGHNPGSTAATGMTLISGNIILQGGDCDGSVFTGLRINESIAENGGDNDHVQILRCVILSVTPNNGFTGSENWIISECIVNSLSNFSNSLLSNNLIVRSLSSSSNCTIENNVFLKYYNSVSIAYSLSCTVRNNIFYEFPNTFLSSNSLYYNNIWSFGNLPNGIFGNGNIGEGNINDTDFDGLFENFSYSTYNGNIEILYPFDLHLVNAAYNTGGTDGTPIGIYGGTFPWKDGSVPFNPRILFKSIGNSTDQNGNLLINIQVEAQDH